MSTTEASFGDVHMTSSRTVHLKWESQPVKCTPTKGTVQFTWKDQGWGNLRGELFLMLMSAAGEEKTSYCLTNHEAPHEWEDVKVVLAATESVLADAVTGCWYQVRAEANAGGGHELYVKNFAFSLTESSEEIERSFGDVSIIDTNAQLRWKSEDMTTTPISGSIQCRWKDQGWGNQKAMLFLNLMAPDGSEKASFTVKDGFAPHEWEDVSVDLVAADAVVAEATVGCWYQVKVECGSGGGQEMNVVGLVLQLAGEVLEPQGTHYPANSSAPLMEAVEWSGTPGAYFNKLKEANGGAPIFKAHPGLACIAITDYAGGKWYFEQPDTVLDRQDGPFFGSLMCSETYVGDSLPALVTNIKESHAAVRAYSIAILMERISSTQTALTHASDTFYANLRKNGLGEYTTVYDTFLQQSYAFMLEWVFGTGEEGGQALPPFADFVNVNNRELSVLMTLKIDTLPSWSAPEPSQSQKDSVEVLLDSIRASKMWPRFMEMLAEKDVPILSPERSFMFNTGFQSSSALAKNMEYAVGVLSAQPDFAAELRTELDGQDLTIASVADVEKFPLLDSFHWEILRMFPAPPFYFKTAKMDLLVPTSTGKLYQMREGDMLYCHHPLVQIDEAKFGTDAREFDPKRFVGNPDLKKDVFAYGFPDPAKVETVDGMPWGCIAHTIGVLDGIIKVFYGRWVQEATWEMTEPTVIDPDLFLGTVGPAGMAFAKVTPR